MFKKSNIPGDVTPKPAAKDATTTVAAAKLKKKLRQPPLSLQKTPKKHNCLAEGVRIPSAFNQTIF